MVNTEESVLHGGSGEADLSPVISLEFYKSVTARGDGKEERGDSLTDHVFKMAEGTVAHLPLSSFSIS